MRSTAIAAFVAALLAGTGLAMPAEVGARPFSARLSDWTQVALRLEPRPQPRATAYTHKWQRELLAFQLSYSRRLSPEAPNEDVDMIETGSISRYQ